MEDITNVNDFNIPPPSRAIPIYQSESVFARICRQFTSDAGKSSLIPSPSLNEAKHLLPLNVVIMKEKRCMSFLIKREYSPYDIRLANLLIGQPELELQTDTSIYCSHKSDKNNSLSGNIKGNMIHIINVSFSTYYDNTITCKLEDLLQRKIGYPSLISALKERKLDMNHHFIREIKDTNQVLCVIRNVITTSDKTEIKVIKETGGNINLSEKLRRIFRACIYIGRKVNSDRAMDIEPGTTLAYEVWELTVDVDSGKITPILTTNHRGGFFNGGKPVRQ